MIKNIIAFCLFLVAAVSGSANEDLVEAVYADDGPAVQDAINNGGANPNLTVQGIPLIAIATQEGHPEALEALIQTDCECHPVQDHFVEEDANANVSRGVNVDAVDSDGFSLLSFASKNGYTVCAQVLVSGGANLAKRDFGLTAFHYACEGHHKHTIHMLLDSAKFSPTDPSDDGKTPMEMVAGHLDLEELLLAYMD